MVERLGYQESGCFREVAVLEVTVKIGSTCILHMSLSF